MDFKRNPTYRIRVGYICAIVKSKAIIYLVQDLLRFNNKDAFEVHVFATSGPDHPNFLKSAMRGIIVLLHISFLMLAPL